ncbi:MAG: MBOAT family O-acyltransferase [Bacteroidales bacterium]
MVFSSIIFIFFFLPAVLLVFHILPDKFRFSFLLISSIFFYFYGESFLIWVMLTTTFIDYCCGIMIVNGFKKNQSLRLPEGGSRTKTQKIWLAVSIISNLGLLGYFKYFNFFGENLIRILDDMEISHLQLDGLINVSLPLGISFYTFQSMSYTIDVYRGHVSANKSLINFSTFVTMFPQLIAGPIVRYSDVEDQMKNHRIYTDDFVVGIKRFITGLAKKVLIANTLALVADQIFSLPSAELSMGIAWIGILSYSLQLYYDFSGYSCMAIGLGKMIGFNFPENFNYPYISKSISEFWQRWHITLSTWFRDYLYFPLGGNRNGNFKTYRNLLIVFVTCGLWHGAEWNYLVWGLSLGFFLIIERFSFFRMFKKSPAIFQHVYMLLAFNLTLVIFRVENLTDAFHYLGVLFGIGGKVTEMSVMTGYLQNNVILIALISIIFSMPTYPYLKKKMEPLILKNVNLANLIYLAVLLLLFILSTMSLASGTYNPFIYFRF